MIKYQHWVTMDTLYQVLLVLGIVVMLILLYFIYSGLLHTVDIKRVESPFPEFLIAYRFSTGPYENCGAAFTQVTDFAPGYKCLGIYYDNPDDVPAKDLRWIVSVVLAEDGETPNSEILTRMQTNGYRVKKLPKVKEVVCCWYPYRTRLSVFLGITFVWRKLGEYIRKSDREAHPWLEMYTSDKIHFIGILDNHDAYYVDEVKAIDKQREAEAEKE